MAVRYLEDDPWSPEDIAPEDMSPSERRKLRETRTRMDLSTEVTTFLLKEEEITKAFSKSRSPCLSFLTVDMWLVKHGSSFMSLVIKLRSSSSSSCLSCSFKAADCEGLMVFLKLSPMRYESEPVSEIHPP